MSPCSLSLYLPVWTHHFYIDSSVLRPILPFAVTIKANSHVTRKTSGHPALQWYPAFLLWRKIPGVFFLSPHPFLATFLDPVGYAKFQFSPLAISTPTTMAFVLIVGTFTQEFAPVLPPSCFQAWFPLGHEDHFLSPPACEWAQKFVLLKIHSLYVQLLSDS